MALILLPTNPAQVVLQATALDVGGAQKTNVVLASVTVSQVVAGIEVDVLAVPLTQVGGSAVWRYVWFGSYLVIGNYVATYSMTDSTGATASAVEDIYVQGN